MQNRFIVILFFFFLSNNLLASHLDSLLNQLNKAKDTTRINLLCEIATSIYTENPDSAIIYSKEAFLLSEKNNYTKGIAQSYLINGRILFVKSDYHLALNEFLKALRYYKLIENDKGIVDTYLNIANIYNHQEKYAKSVKINLISLKYLEKSNDKEGICYAYLSIGGNLLKNNQFKSAKKFFIYAIELSSEIHDTLKLVQSYNNLGNIYLEEELFEKSLYFYNKALEINQKVNNKRSQAFNYGNIANVYNYQKNFSDALKYYLISKQIFEEIGEKTFITFSYYNIGNLLFNQKKHNEAKTYFYTSIEKANEIGNRNIYLMANKKLAELYAHQHDYLSAYKYWLNHDSIKEMIIKEDNLQKISELEKRYETEKKQKEINQLHLINVNHKLEEEKSKWTNLSLSVSLIVLITGGGILIKRNKEKKNINRNLELAVKERTMQLEAQNSEKELMLKEIHHRVKNNLQLISSLLKLQLHYYPNMSAEHVVDQFSNKIKCMAMIHDKLYAATDFNNLKVKDYFSDLCNLIKSMSDSPKTEILFNFENHELPLDRMIPCGLILNELVSNSLKHGYNLKSKGLIQVNFYKQETSYNLSVVDNGKGFRNDIDFENLSSLGLSIVHDLVEQLNGNISFQKEKDNETIVLINFPGQV